MLQSDQKLSKSKGKSKADSFVWTDDEVQLFRKVTNYECEVSKTSEMLDLVLSLVWGGMDLIL